MRDAAATQVRVIGALMLREARTRFGRSQLGYLWTLAEPIAMIATFTGISYAMGHVPPYGSSLPMFFALGTLAYLFYKRIAGYCSSAFDANQALLTYPIVKQIDTLFARMLLELLTCLFIAVMVLGLIVAVQGVPFPARPDAMALAVALLVLLGFGNGALNAVISTFVPSWRNIEAMITRPLFFMSGVFFVPDRMPPSIIPYLAWNPLLHGIELIRFGYYPDYRSPACSVTYLFFWAMSLTVLGLLAERAMRVRHAAEAGAG
jgi:capsular polysaccharide transport system permease protein